MTAESHDQSALDRKYFLTSDTYNCPFCRRGSVHFTIISRMVFHWTRERGVLAIYVRCSSCDGISFHLSNNLDLIVESQYQGKLSIRPKFINDDMDSHFFFHQPSSFFTLDARIPRKIRDLIQEAIESQRSGFLVGASACLRKAIYVLLEIEGVPKTEGGGGDTRERHYQDRVRDLKTKREHMDPTFVDVLAHALELTSDQLHEDSWDGWSTEEFNAVADATMSVLREMYVVPEERKERASRTANLVDRMKARVSGVKTPEVKK